MKTTLSTLVVALACTSTVYAVPIQAVFLPDPMHCDGPLLTPYTLTHEIGDGTAANPFPLNERISVSVQPLPVPFASCVADDGVPNDWLIRIVNLSPITWQDLYFVADDAASVVGNFDGVMQDPNNPNTPPSQAYRIDGTITPGVNNPLLLETGPVDEWFQPGESWSFQLINFLGGTPSFGSIGSYGLGSLSNGFSTASILANPVPEPTGGLLVTLALAAVCCRRNAR